MSKRKLLEHDVRWLEVGLNLTFFMCPECAAVVISRSCPDHGPFVDDTVERTPCVITAIDREANTITISDV